MSEVVAQPVRIERSNAALVIGVWIIVIGLVYLSRVGIQFGDKFVSTCMLTTYTGMFLIVFSGNASAESGRLLLYLFMISFALFSALLVNKGFSLLSLELLLVIYVPFIFVVDIDEPTYKRCMNVWQLAMLPVMVVALVQFITQDRYDLFEEYFSNFVLPGFNTRPIIQYGSTFRKSDGMFLLEPSYLSQFSSIALALELLYFQKKWRVAAYVVGMVTSVSLSGVVMLSVFLVVYAWRYGRIPHVLLAAGVVVAGLWAFQDNEVVHSVLNRSSEINPNETDSSAYNRFVAPLYETTHLVTDLPTLLIGVGPGNSSSDRLLAGNVSQDVVGGMWPPLKMLAEYGILPTVALCLFIWRCFVVRSRSYILSTMLLLQYILMAGALLGPQAAYVVLVLVALFPQQFCEGAFHQHPPDQRERR